MSDLGEVSFKSNFHTQVLGPRGVRRSEGLCSFPCATVFVSADPVAGFANVCQQVSFRVTHDIDQAEPLAKYLASRILSSLIGFNLVNYIE